MTDEQFVQHQLKLKIIQVGKKHHLDRFVNDPNPIVRAAVAHRGFKEHLDKLVHDEDSYVRLHIPKHKHKKHLDLLVHDVEPQVREVVADQGRPEHKLELLKDFNTLVRRHATRNSDNDTLTKFFKMHKNHSTADARTGLAAGHVANHLSSNKKPRDPVNHELFRAIAQNEHVGRFFPSVHETIGYETNDPKTMEILSRHKLNSVRASVYNNPDLKTIPPSPIKDRILRQARKGAYK